MHQLATAIIVSGEWEKKRPVVANALLWPVAAVLPNTSDKITSLEQPHHSSPYIVLSLSLSLSHTHTHTHTHTSDPQAHRSGVLGGFLPQSPQKSARKYKR
jgi:hypothetical protein